MLVKQERYEVERKTLMYLYSIGYGSYEESHYVQYWHERKLSEQELSDLVVDCMVETIEHYAGRFEENGYNEDMFHSSEEGPSFQEILESEVFEQSLQYRGFKTVEFEAKFNIFGWPSAMDDTSWRSDTEEETKGMQRQIASRCREKGIFVEDFFPDVESEKAGISSQRLNLMKNVWSEAELVARRLKNEYPFVPKKKRKEDGNEEQGQ